MAIDLGNYSGPRRKKSGNGSIEYRLIFFVSFCFFLIATAFERLLPWRWMQASGDGHRRASIFSTARNAAETCTTYAFMG
jgi:hypothetical protein